MSDANAGMVALARKLKTIRDPGMRCHALARALRDFTHREVVEILAAALASSRDGDARGLLLADTLTATLTDTELLTYDTRANLYVSAKAAGHTALARLLFTASPTGDNDDDLPPERPIIPRGKPLTLGERKSLARGHRRELLQHLLRDPHPDVVTILLDNPHITEADVLVIATRRMPRPGALVAVARNHRWRIRYNVRRALVLNPHTPALEALRLATTLRPADLRMVADDPNLAAPLRQQARELLEP